jgi:signal peptidase I
MRTKFWTDGFGSFIVAVALALIVRWAFFEAYVIPSTSMLPTLLVNDHIFVNKISYGMRWPLSEKWILEFGNPDRGDVVVFKYPNDKNQFFIKRIVGLPGDHILYDNGNLYVNEKLVERRIPEIFRDDGAWIRDEDFVGEEKSGGKLNYVHWEEVMNDRPYSVLLRKDQPKITFGPYIVPPDHYFVMGDNRNNSQDSREWEDSKRFVPRSYLIGRATFVWLSCEKTFATLPFLCHPLSIRWSRLFHGIH